MGLTILGPRQLSKNVGNSVLPVILIEGHSCYTDWSLCWCISWNHTMANSHLTLNLGKVWMISFTFKSFRVQVQYVRAFCFNEAKWLLCVRWIMDSTIQSSSQEWMRLTYLNPTRNYNHISYLGPGLVGKLCTLEKQLALFVHPSL